MGHLTHFSDMKTNLVEQRELEREGNFILRNLHFSDSLKLNCP